MVTETKSGTGPRLIDGRAGLLESDVRAFTISQRRREGSRAADLSEWAQNGGMWSRAVRIRWSHLLRFQETGPVVLLFSDGGAGLLAGASAERDVIFLKSPDAPDDGEAVAIDKLRLSQVWTG